MKKFLRWQRKYLYPVVTAMCVIWFAGSAGWYMMKNNTTNAIIAVVFAAGFLFITVDELINKRYE